MAKHIVKTEEDWHALRAQYITASEASVLVGADPFSSPAKIREPTSFTGNSFTRVGQMLEPVVVNVVNDILGTNFQLYETPEGWKEFYTEGHFGATPDAHENRKCLLECKTTRPQTFLKYSVIPPSKYLVQLIVQMMCTNIDLGYLAVMSTNLTQATSELIWPISIFKVWKDDRICDILNLEAQRFRDCIEKDKMFRVNSKVKQKVKLLLSMNWENVNGIR